MYSIKINIFLDLFYKFWFNYYKSCQWPCSADHIFPGGAAFGGFFGIALEDEDTGREGASCQWPCSTDQTFPGGASSNGEDILFGTIAGSDS